MKNRFFLGLFLVMAFVACNKNEPTVEEPSTEPEVEEPDYFPMNVGSYWVYNTYKIDSLGNEELLSANDTLMVLDSVEANNSMYKLFYGKRFGFNNQKESFYYKDSAEFIVNNEGKMVFSQYNFTDTLYQTSIESMGETIYFWFAMMKEELETVTVPAGTFNNLLNKNIQIEYKKDPSDLITNTKSLYAPMVGRILHQYIYINDYKENKTYFEERLVDFYIP